MLTIVAAMAHGRPVWQSPPDRRQEADAAKGAPAAGSAAARSDHVASVAAYLAWNAARLKGGRQAAFAVRPGRGVHSWQVRALRLTGHGGNAAWVPNP